MYTFHNKWPLEGQERWWSSPGPGAGSKRDAGWLCWAPRHFVPPASYHFLYLKILLRTRMVPLHKENVCGSHIQRSRPGASLCPVLPAPLPSSTQPPDLWPCCTPCGLGRLSRHPTAGQRHRDTQQTSTVGPPSLWVPAGFKGSGLCWSTAAPRSSWSYGTNVHASCWPVLSWCSGSTLVTGLSPPHPR